MAKLTGPLFSLRARASIGRTLTYASWRGIQYVRTDVIPANPRSTTQVQVREVFAYLNGLWLQAPQALRDPWTAQARGNPYTDRNHLVGLNANQLYGAGSNDDIILSPGNGGPVPISAVPTGGVGTITWVITAPTPPVGWTLVSATALAVVETDPTFQGANRYSNADTDAAPAISPANTIPASQVGDFVVAAYLTWTDASGFTRYSHTSQPSVVTVT